MGKTHWKKILDSNYLGGQDLDDGKGGHKTVHLTISKATNDTITGENGRKDNAPVVHFSNFPKPMILNKTNSKVIEKLTGSPYIEDWVGLTIEVYYDPDVRFGKDKVGGVRIRPKKIQPQKAPEPTPECSDCHQIVPEYMGIAGAVIAAEYKKVHGVPLCYECGQARKAKMEESKKEASDGTDAE